MTAHCGCFYVLLSLGGGNFPEDHHSLVENGDDFMARVDKVSGSS